MNSDTSHEYPGPSDERLGLLRQRAIALGVTHPLIVEWPVTGNALAYEARLVATAIDEEQSLHERASALRCLEGQLARGLIHIEGAYRFACDLYRLLEKESTSIELMQALLRLIYRMLGYKHLVNLRLQTQRTTFELTHNGTTIDAGFNIPIASRLLLSAYSHLMNLSHVDVLAMCQRKRQWAAELLLTHFLHGHSPKGVWTCGERREQLMNAGRTFWALLKRGEAEDELAEDGRPLPGALDDEAFEVVVGRLAARAGGSEPPIQKIVGRTTPEKEEPPFRAFRTHVVIPGPIPPANEANDKEMIARYAPLQRDLPVVELPEPAELLSVQTDLVAEFPWAKSGVEEILGELLLKRQLGGVDCRLRPTLIAGRPGVGKTRFARRLAEELGLTFRAIGVGGMDDSRILLGTSRGWASGQPSSLLELLLKANSPTALVLLDEVEKANNRTVNSPAVASALLGLLEPESAERWFDSFLQTECDLSMMSFILTANSLQSLPDALLSRCHLVMFDEPSREHIEAVVPYALQDLAGDWGLPKDIFKGFEYLARSLPVRSMRELKGMLTHVLKAEMLPQGKQGWRH